MARHTGGRQRRHNDDEPYMPLPRPRGASSVPAKQEARGWWVGGEWIEAPSAFDPRSRLSPIVIEDNSENDCYEVPPPAPRANRATQNVDTFDFNNGGQNVPWATNAHGGQRYAAHGRFETARSLSPIASSQPRSFADSADDELLSYMAERSISRGFLVEIDQFFRSHPEIADCPEGRETITQLNRSSPLEAYRYFLRGYTRPARYIEGIVKSAYFMLPANYPYQPLRTKVDPELVDFFEGFDYRWDIIHRIDHAVRAGIQALSCGQPVNSGWRRLICYAVWGNPSDAYKWYEYQLQEEYLPHRYLPEHVVLGHLPKLAGEAEAQPSSLGSSRRHMHVRYHMARANDEGIDVLDVLMTEFKATLVRKGFRRIDIEDMYERAKERLENERRDPTGVDIVDLIMDEIPTQGPARRIIINSNNIQYTHAAFDQFKFNAKFSRQPRRTRMPQAKAKNVPQALRAQASELRVAKTNLERVYTQTQNFQNLSSRCTGVTISFPQITAARARLERRYVNCLVRYLRNANRMSGVEATQMQKNFTKRKMEKSGVDNSAFLLGMYPYELK